MSSNQQTWVVFNVLLMLTIVHGNGLVVAAYGKNNRLRTRTYTFLASLAFSDLLVGSVALPIRIYGDLRAWQVSQELQIFYNCFDIFSACASIFHLSAVSIERFIAVSRPFYFEVLSFRAYFIAICLAWGLAIVTAATYPGVYTRQSLLQLKIDPFQIYGVILFAASFVCPLVLIVSVNTRIFWIARSLIRRSPEVNRTARRVLRERKTAMTLAFISSFFFICWFPFFVLNMFFLYCPKCLPSPGPGMMQLVDFVKWMHYCNSAINPIVYAFRDTEMRKTFSRLLGPFGRVCKFRNLVHSDSSRSSSALAMRTMPPTTIAEGKLTSQF